MGALLGTQAVDGALLPKALEANADWLTTVTPTDWLALHPPAGRVYIPTSTYTEMTEWVLPPADSIEFEPSCCSRPSTNRPEARYLRGGFWRNFQRRYREINDLHKQMLRTSAAVHALERGDVRDRALDHLLKGQSNDCYWHGLFGGVYITHMRLATFEHLIAAADIVDWATTELAGAGAATATARLVDLDLDGIDEALLGNPGPGRGGQARPGRGHRRVGHPRRAARADGGAAPTPRGIPRAAHRGHPVRPAPDQRGAA